MKKTLVLMLALGLVLMAGSALAQPEDFSQAIGTGTQQITTAVNDVDNANALGTQNVTSSEGQVANTTGTQSNTLAEDGQAIGTSNAAGQDAFAAGTGNQAADGLINTNQASGTGDNQDGLVNTDDSLNDNNTNVAGAQAAGTQNQTQDGSGLINTNQATGTGDNQDGLVNTDDSLNDNNLGIGKNNNGTGTQTITDLSPIAGASSLSGPAQDGFINTAQSTGTGDNQDGLINTDDSLNDNNLQFGRNNLGEGTQTVTDNSNIAGASSLSGPAQDGLINTLQAQGSGSDNNQQDGLLNVNDTLNDNAVAIAGAAATGSNNNAQDGKNNLGSGTQTITDLSPVLGAASLSGNAQNGLVNTNQEATGTQNTQQDGVGNIDDSILQGSGVNTAQVGNTGQTQDGLVNTAQNATGTGNTTQQDGLLNVDEVALAGRNANVNGTQTITDMSNIAGANALGGDAQDGLINIGKSPINIGGAQTGSGDAYDQNGRYNQGSGTMTITELSPIAGASSLSGPAINADDGVVTAGGSISNVFAADDPDGSVQHNGTGNVIAMDEKNDLGNVNMGDGTQTNYASNGKYALGQGTMTNTEISPEKGSQASLSGNNYNAEAKSFFGAQATGTGNNSKAVGIGLLGVGVSTADGDIPVAVAWDEGQATNNGNNVYVGGAHEGEPLGGPIQTTGSGNNVLAEKGGLNQIANGSAIQVGQVEKGGMVGVAGGSQINNIADDNVNNVAANGTGNKNVVINQSSGGVSAAAVATASASASSSSSSIEDLENNNHEGPPGIMGVGIGVPQNIAVVDSQTNKQGGNIAYTGGGSTNINHVDNSYAKQIVPIGQGVAAAGALTAHSESPVDGVATDVASAATSFTTAPTPTLNLNMNKSAVGVNIDKSKKNPTFAGATVQTVTYDVLEQTVTGVAIGDQILNTYGGNSINFGNGGNVQGITALNTNLGGHAVNNANKVITNVSNVTSPITAGNTLPPGQ